MKRYIEITISGKRYRFLIDEELEKELKLLLKDKYIFNSDNVLIIEDDDINEYYYIRQLILKAILNQINNYNIPLELQDRINFLKDFINKKSTIYSSDLTVLENALGEVSQIYNNVRSSLTQRKVTTYQKNNLNSNEVNPNIVDTSTLEINKENESIRGVTDTTNDKVGEFKAVVEEIAEDEEFKDIVPTGDITDAIDRVVICASTEEFIQKTGSTDGNYNVANAIKNKNEKIILPPNTKIEDVAVEILKTYISNDTVLEKVVTYAERKATYKSKTDSVFDTLRSKLKVSGLTARNLNYFGDQFFDSFEAICKESGMSFDSMFADYFNSYSANRRYNSPIDKFIRLFNKYNGGDDNTRALLEAMLVKKAIGRGLISRRYNRALRSDYQNLEVNRYGYINFNEESFRRTMPGGISDGLTSKEMQANRRVETEESAHIGDNNHSYESDLNRDIKPPQDQVGENIPSDVSTTDDAILQNNLPLNPVVNQQRNRRQGELQSTTMGGITEQTETARSITGVNGRRFTSNTALNPSLISLEEEEETELEDNDGIDESNDGETAPSTESLGGDSGSDLDDDTNSEDSNDGLPSSGDLADTSGGEEEKNEKKKSKILEFIKKNPWTWGVIGFLIFLLFLFLIIISSSNDDKNQGLGYYDSACNFNDTRVIITSCNSEESLQNLDLQDYVTRMAYLYTKDGTYSDETIKALMIILKTNALSLGNYRSSSKNVSVRICDIYNGTIDETALFSGAEDSLDKFDTLYDSVSEYLFVSASYKSSINSLSSVNAITISDTTLTDLENVAATGATYSEILEEVFKVETEENIIVNDARENIFLGDSRTQGILNTGVINDNNTVYGVGYGYNWLVGSSGFNGTTNASNGGINGVNSKLTTGRNYNIIIWLGVNDLGNANNYLEKYIELAEGQWSNHNIYVVSVGPVQDSKSRYAKNDTIQTFNTTIKDGIAKANLANLKYIDLGYTENSISNYDNAGVHYGSTDYQNIYNKITSSLIGSSGPTSISTKLALYRLSDYCTYYSLTENDAYWWPIGSKEATNGNIYGGTPISTYVKSPFGMRFHPIKEVYKMHTGIDISGVDTSSPVIATKNGTVTYVHEGCTATTCSCNKNGYGNYIKVDHGDGVVSLYAHLSSVVVRQGDVVTQGQRIGMVGTTGCSTGNHLHFEIQLNGTAVNPLDYINAENPRPVNFAVSNIDGAIVVVGDNGDYSDSSKNKSVVCKSLRASGFSENATIGILSNMQRESDSTFSPEIVEYASGYNISNIYTAPDSVAAGFGIVQWSWGRRINLINYARENGANPASMVAQLNFFYKEVSEKPEYAITNKYITGAYSGYDTAVAFCKNYERPRGSVRDLTVDDSCTDRATAIVPNMTTYVKNGCQE